MLEQVQEAAIQPKDEDSLLGVKLRSRRRELNLTLQDLSKRSGLSTASISQVERNVTAPSLRSLRKLCAALNMSLVELFSQRNDREQTDSDIVLRTGTRASISLGSEGVFKELLTPSSFSKLQAMIIAVDPGCSSGLVPLTIELGERAGIVTEGALGLEVDGRTVYLERGDSFGVCVKESLRFWCASDVRCEVVWMAPQRIY